MSRRKQYLLQKYWAKQCNQEELEELLAYLREDRTHEDYDDIIADLWKHLPEQEALSSEASSALFRRIQARTVRQPFPIRRVAAILAVVFGLSVYYLWREYPVTHTAGYGQTVSVTLPDQSTVTLNSNSTLRYRRHWANDAPRTVHLTGEAYFSVQHTPYDQPFIVHAERLAVEVLGTEFNVQQRRGTTRVTLRSGQVKLSTSKEETVRVDNVIMQPGEQATLTAQRFNVTAVATEPVVAWKEHKLMYDDVPLEEVARTIEDLYGRPILIESDSLRHLKLTGTLPHDDLNTLLAMLGEIFSLRVTEAGDTLRLHP